jgi:hypothetical protein
VRGLLAALLLIGGPAAADTCAPIGTTGYLIMDHQEFVPFEWGTTLFVLWNEDTPTGPTDKTTILKNGLELRFWARERQVIVMGETLSQRTVGFLEGVLSSNPPMTVRCKTSVGTSGVNWCLAKLGQLEKNSIGCGEGDE